MKADELDSLRPHLPPGYMDGDNANNEEHGPVSACEVNKSM